MVHLVFLRGLSRDEHTETLIPGQQTLGWFYVYPMMLDNCAWSWQLLVVPIT